MEKSNVVNYTVPSVQDLFKAGFHFGHTKSKWYPKMEEYIYTTKDGVHIIDINKTVSMFSRFLDELGKRARVGSVLVVGTKKQATNAVKTFALEIGMHYVSNRWPGGTLTNFELVRDGIKKMMSLEEEYYKGMLDRTKKERLEVKKKLDRKKFLFDGVVFMDKLPKAVVVIDSLVERSVINEAKALSIPVFGMCDTNCNPEAFDCFIPGNDDATKSIELLLKTIGQVIKDTTSARELKAQVERRVKMLSQFEAEATEEKRQKAAEIELKAQKMRAMKDENLAKKTLVTKIEPKKSTVKEIDTKKVDVKKEPAVKKVIKKKTTKVKTSKMVEKPNKVELKELGLTDREFGLLKDGKFKTIAEIKKAGKEGLMEVKGIGEKMAEKILKEISKLK